MGGFFKHLARSVKHIEHKVAHSTSKPMMVVHNTPPVNIPINDAMDTIRGLEAKVVNASRVNNSKPLTEEIGAKKGVEESPNTHKHPISTMPAKSQNQHMMEMAGVVLLAGVLTYKFM